MSYNDAEQFAKQAHEYAGAAAGQTSDEATRKLAWSLHYLAKAVEEVAAQLHKDS